MSVEWLPDCRSIKVTPPKKPKKLTGTRFATVMGLNPRATPFEAWCAITKTYKKPHDENKFTRAGKVIEPKQADYLRRVYLMDDLVTPEDRYGKDFYETTRGDFFGDVEIFGGMWDSLRVRPNGEEYAVIEYKTTKRTEDWELDIPEYYALQAAEYAYLKGIDDVIMVCSFLEDEDYDHPEDFVPSPDNTITRHFRVSERYPNMLEMMEWCHRWWRDHVQTGISPAYDEKRDAEILKALRTNCAHPTEDLEALLAEAETLYLELAGVKEKEKRYKEVTGALRAHMSEQFRDGDQAVVLHGKTINYTLSRNSGTTIDKDRLEADGLLERYSNPTTTYRLNVAPVK